MNEILKKELVFFILFILFILSLVKTRRVWFGVWGLGFKV